MLGIAGQEALDLGLLFSTEETTLEETQPKLLTFGHKSLQEYAGGHYVAPLSKASLAWIVRHENKNIVLRCLVCVVSFPFII